MLFLERSASPGLEETVGLGEFPVFFSFSSHSWAVVFKETSSSQFLSPRSPRSPEAFPAYALTVRYNEHMGFAEHGAGTACSALYLHNHHFPAEAAGVGSLLIYFRIEHNSRHLAVFMVCSVCVCGSGIPNHSLMLVLSRGWEFCPVD